MDHPLIAVLSQLTGLEQASGKGMPPAAALRDHQDLFAIAHAAFALLKAEPETQCIAPSSLLPYFKTMYSGNKRSAAFKAAAEAQRQRVRAILERANGGIYVTKTRAGEAFSLIPPVQ